MSFRILHDYVQTCAVPVDLTGLRAEVGRLLPPGRRVRVKRDPGLSQEMSRGYWVSPKNPDRVFLGLPDGVGLILLSDELNGCWSRFVEIKEMMHIFDDDLEFTNNEEELEALLFGLCEDVKGERSLALQSEYDCFWRALGLVCPEVLRVELQAQRAVNAISDLEIAHRLLIPERVVPGLFMPRYKTNIRYLKTRFG